MAAAVVSAASHKIPLHPDALRDKGNGAAIPVAVLPDKKEWIEEHNLSMLMLDG
jgi:hypothetical protein